MDDEKAEDAANEAVDPDRLLEGERQDSGYLDDATHWRQVYGELLIVKRDLLHVVEERLDKTLHFEARREVVHTDLVVLDAELKRFVRRHDFWTRRCQELVEQASSQR
ncbi:MAG: hypothetical protein M3R48_01270 [Candidatus Dormibacteraeota bacterium]|nr:hypothetical protein [Candidatus Dormibacteraeota bacterium]